MNLEVHWSFLKHTEELLFRKVVTTYAIYQRSVSASLQIFSTKYYDLSILFLLFCQGKRGAGGWLSVGSCDQVTPLRVTSGKDVFSGWKITGSVGTSLFPLPFHFSQPRTGSCRLGIAGKRKEAWGPGSLCVPHGKNTPDWWSLRCWGSDTQAGAILSTSSEGTKGQWGCFCKSSIPVFYQHLLPRQGLGAPFSNLYEVFIIIDINSIIFDVVVICLLILFMMTCWLSWWSSDVCNKSYSWSSQLIIGTNSYFPITCHLVVLSSTVSFSESVIHWGLQIRDFPMI